MDLNDEERVADRRRGLPRRRSAPAQSSPPSPTASSQFVFDLAPPAVVLLRPGVLPTASSGKIPSACAYRQAFWPAVSPPTRPKCSTRWDEPAAAERREPAPAERGGRIGRLGASLAAALGLPAAAVQPDQPLTRFGLDSLGASPLNARSRPRPGSGCR